MKFLTLLFSTATLLFSQTYYAKVEPYEMKNISSNVAGLVLAIDEDNIGKVLTKKSYISIDDEINQRELLSIKDKIEYLRETVNNSKYILNNLKLSLDKKRKNYKKIERLSIKSVVEKDREFHDLINSENSYLNTKKEINSLKIQITDLKFRRAQLSRTIKDKNLKAEGFTLYSILVEVGQVVNISTPLAKVADVSKAKLTIFLNDSDVLDTKNKIIYIDNVKTKYKIDRVLKIADSINISKYKAQIIIDAPKLFSTLVQVDLRDE